MKNVNISSNDMQLAELIFFPLSMIKAVGAERQEHVGIDPPVED